MTFSFSPPRPGALSLVVALLAATAAHPQAVLRDGLATGPKSARPAVASGGLNAALVPFGDGFATRKLATALLAEAGMTYIDHDACQGQSCDTPDTVIPTPASVSQMELTGFHPRQGVATLVITDQPCTRSGAAAGAAAATTIQTRRAGCLGDFRAHWRILTDLGFAYSADGWTALYVHRIEVPRLARGDQANARGLWTHASTIELKNIGWGWAQISDGAWQERSARVTLASGETLHHTAQSTFTIPGSSGDIPFDPGLFLDPDRTLGTVGSASSTANRLTVTREEAIAYCDKMAEETSNVAGVKFGLAAAIAQTADEMLKNFQPSTTTLGGKQVQDGNSVTAEATWERPDLSGPATRFLDKAQKGVKGDAFLKCMAELNQQPPVTDPGQVPGTPGLLDQGEREDPFEVDTASIGTGGDSCESDSSQTTEEVKISGVTCTKTTWTDCDSSCNCTSTETVDCPIDVVR